MTKDEMRLWSEAYGCAVLATGSLDKPVEAVAAYATLVANNALDGVRSRELRDLDEDVRDGVSDDDWPEAPRGSQE